METSLIKIMKKSGIQWDPDRSEKPRYWRDVGHHLLELLLQAATPLLSTKQVDDARRAFRFLIYEGHDFFVDKSVSRVKRVNANVNYCMTLSLSSSIVISSGWIHSTGIGYILQQYYMCVCVYNYIYVCVCWKILQSFLRTSPQISLLKLICSVYLGWVFQALIECNVLLKLIGAC